MYLPLSLHLHLYRWIFDGCWWQSDLLIGRRGTNVERGDRLRPIGANQRETSRGFISPPTLPNYHHPEGHLLSSAMLENSKVHLFAKWLIWSLARLAGGNLDQTRYCAIFNIRLGGKQRSDCIVADSEEVHWRQQFSWSWSVITQTLFTGIIDKYWTVPHLHHCHHNCHFAMIAKHCNLGPQSPYINHHDNNDDDNDDGVAPESNWFWPKWKQQALPPICPTTVACNHSITGGRVPENTSKRREAQY